MAPRDLLLHGVPVIDREQEPAVQSQRDVAKAIEGCEIGFHALAFLRMDAETLQVIKHFCSDAHELLDEEIAVGSHPQLAGVGDHVHRQGVEELVGKNDGALSGGDIREPFNDPDLAACDVFCKSAFQPGAQGGG
jgi:hypothetical protein